jgi:hypothetical protein
MARRIDLQQATAEHYDFALHLYLLTMRPYLQETQRVGRTTGENELRGTMETRRSADHFTPKVLPYDSI